jgi:hypothetical protein
MHTDVRATVDSNDTVAEMAAAQVENQACEIDFVDVELRCREQLKADTERSAILIGGEVVAVDDHVAVIGRGEYEGDGASGIGHESLLLKCVSGRKEGPVRTPD